MRQGFDEDVCQIGVSGLSTARPVHIGSASQVWEIRIDDDAEKLVCISRLTLAVLDRAPTMK